MKRCWISPALLPVSVCLLIVPAWKYANGAELLKRPDYLFIFVDNQSWSGTSVAILPGNQLSRTPACHPPRLEATSSQRMIVPRDMRVIPSGNAPGRLSGWDAGPPAETGGFRMSRRS
jgi:hypothetical protein